jgi:hypothetical protein
MAGRFVPDASLPRGYATGGRQAGKFILEGIRTGYKQKICSYPLPILFSSHLHPTRISPDERIIIRETAQVIQLKIRIKRIK